MEGAEAALFSVGTSVCVEYVIAQRIRVMPQNINNQQKFTDVINISATHIYALLDTSLEATKLITTVN
jgi:hypothetical protein